MFGFCWHKWTKWGPVQTEITLLLGFKDREVSVQLRECKKCGVVEKRHV